MTYIKCVFLLLAIHFLQQTYTYIIQIFLFTMGTNKKHWHLNYERIFSHEIFTSETGTQRHFKYLINTKLIFYTVKVQKTLKTKYFV